jgi:uncharacterized RDD family membrane protein YckC
LEAKPGGPGPISSRMPPLRLLLGGLLLGLSSAGRAVSQAETTNEEGLAASSAQGVLPAPASDGTGSPRPQTEGAGETRAMGRSSMLRSERPIIPIAPGLAGLLLESGKQAARGANTAEQSIRELADLVAGSGLPGTRGTRRTVVREASRMEARGQAELDRLAAIGLAEEQRLAASAEAAFRDAAADIVDDVVALAIERMAESPKIHRMIRQESSTLLEDFLQGVRLWCANADDLLERGARRVFRRGTTRPEVSTGASEPGDVAAVDASAVVLPAYTGPAGFVSRAAALLLDAVLVTCAAAAGGYLVSVTLQALRPGILGQYLPALPAGLGGLMFLIYFVFCWGVLGRTIGMGLIGLKVVTLRERRVSFPRAVLRYIGYLVSTLFIFVGFLWVLVDNRRLGWLDHIARTQVIRAHPLPTDHGSQRQTR